MANEKVSKVIFGGQVLIDLTSDTVTAAKLLKNETAHGADGELITGSCEYDSDTSNDTATADEILYSKTAHARGTALTGAMTNNGAVSGTISTKAGTYTVPQGYHDGSGTVGISSTEQDKIIATNIKSGVTILGVEGTYSGETIDVEANKNVTPSTSQQVITPSSGYDYLAQVTVAAIPYTTALNAAGGLTATIAGA